MPKCFRRTTDVSAIADAAPSVARLAIAASSSTSRSCSTTGASMVDVQRTPVESIDVAARRTGMRTTFIAAIAVILAACSSESDPPPFPRDAYCANVPPCTCTVPGESCHPSLYCPCTPPDAGRD